MISVSLIKDSIVLELFAGVSSLPWLHLDDLQLPYAAYGQVSRAHLDLRPRGLREAAEPAAGRLRALGGAGGPRKLSVLDRRRL